MKPPLTATDPIEVDVETATGIRVTVTAYVHESGVFCAEVRYVGGGVITDLSRSYRHEAEARAYCRTTVKLLHAGWTIARLIELRDLMHTETPPPGRAANGDRGPAGTTCLEDQ